MSRRLLGLTLALATAGFGLLGTPAANASCLVNLGNCSPTGGCEVNTGTCNSGGECTVNFGVCDTGGVCTVNLGHCGTGCTILVNVDNCAPSDNTVVVEGSGTIDPGLPCPASGCTIHLDFTAAFAGQNASGTATCTFDGTDTFPGGATVVAGSGSGTISCTGGVSASGTVTFTRTGAVVNVGGSLTVNGQSCTPNVTLAFVPSGTPPVRTFSVTGGGTVTCP
jgi:hypothetical protein